MTTIAAARPIDFNPRAMPGDNRLPLDEEIVAEFNEAVDAHPGLRSKIDALITRAATAAPCADGEMAGKYADFIKMTATCEGLVDAERVRIKAPILAAQRALDGAAKGIADDLAGAKTKVKRHLDTFIAAENARVQAARRAAEQARLDAERAAREDADRERARLQAIEDARAAKAHRAAQVIEIEAEPAPAEAAPIDAPVFRGDLGSRVGVRTVWRHRIDSVRQLPDAILKHPSVVEALDKVVAAQVRGGARTIKGATIWDEQTSSVR